MKLSELKIELGSTKVRNPMFKFDPWLIVTRLNLDRNYGIAINGYGESRSLNRADFENEQWEIVVV